MELSEMVPFLMYASAGNDNFVKYMAGHRTQYNDGADYMPKCLMSLTLNKYTNLSHNKQ